MSNRAWIQNTRTATVAELHASPLDKSPHRLLRRCIPTDSALVLGRSQKRELVDETTMAQRQLDVVRRLSGGGAVLVESNNIVWFDVVIPADDPLWVADVGRAFWWLGDVIASALDAQGISADVHKGALLQSQWTKQACFAGLGPGEVLVDGRKAVGVSQRRTREGAVFQCSLYRSHDTQLLAHLLRMNLAEATSFIAHMKATTSEIPDIDADKLMADLGKFLANL